MNPADDKQTFPCKKGAATCLKARSLGSSGNKDTNIIQMGKSNFQSYTTTNLLGTSLPIWAAYIVIVTKYIMQNINYYMVALS
jgi:hypothetical protein